MSPLQATTSSTGRIFTRCCWGCWSPTRRCCCPPTCWRRWSTSSAGRCCCARGELVGDVTTLELEEQGRSLMDFVKETYRYQADRVSRALPDLTGEEEDGHA